jgi:hypothetical protein
VRAAHRQGPLLLAVRSPALLLTPLLMTRRRLAPPVVPLPTAVPQQALLAPRLQLTLAHPTTPTAQLLALLTVAALLSGLGMMVPVLLLLLAPHLLPDCVSVSPLLCNPFQLPRVLTQHPALYSHLQQDCGGRPALRSS